MAEVKWTARRVTDGVLVDVTGETESTPQPAPVANELEAGSSTSPVTFTSVTLPFDTPNLLNDLADNGVAALAVPANTLVQAVVVEDENWDSQVQWVVAISNAVDGSLLDQVTYESGTASAEAFGLQEPSPLALNLATLAASVHRWTFTLTPASVWVAGNDEGAVSAGNIRVFAIMLTLS